MMAQLCPFEYGENVYLARIMLKLTGDTTEYSNECETDASDMPEKSMMFGSDNEFTTTVYPNPAQNEITVETNITLPATLTLYSATGQQLYSVQINDPVSIVTINFLKPQLMLYEIRNASGETNRGTLTKTE